MVGPPADRRKAQGRVLACSRGSARKVRSPVRAFEGRSGPTWGWKPKKRAPRASLAVGEPRSPGGRASSARDACPRARSCSGSLRRRCRRSTEFAAALRYAPRGPRRPRPSPGIGEHCRFQGGVEGRWRPHVEALVARRRALPGRVGDGGAPVVVPADAELDGARRGARRFARSTDLMWDRPFLRRLFGLDHLIEVDKREPERVVRDYVLPLLVGDLFVGRADLKADCAARRAAGQALHPGARRSSLPRRPARRAATRLARSLGLESVEFVRRCSFHASGLLSSRRYDRRTRPHCIVASPICASGSWARPREGCSSPGIAEQVVEQRAARGLSQQELVGALRYDAVGDRAPGVWGSAAADRDAAPHRRGPRPRAARRVPAPDQRERRSPKMTITVRRRGSSRPRGRRSCSRWADGVPAARRDLDVHARRRPRPRPRPGPERPSSPTRLSSARRQRSSVRRGASRVPRGSPGPRAQPGGRPDRARGAQAGAGARARVRGGGPRTRGPARARPARTGGRGRGAGSRAQRRSPESASPRRWTARPATRSSRVSVSSRDDRRSLLAARVHAPPGVAPVPARRIRRRVRDHLRLRPRGRTT